MKKVLFILLQSSLSFYVCGQWSGPTSGWLSTSNSVSITQLGGQNIPGNPSLPMLSLSLTGLPTSGNGSVPGGTLFPLHVAYSGKVGIGTNAPIAGLHVMNTNILVSRVNGSDAFSFNPAGSLTVTTDGINHLSRGLFINNGTSNFFSVSPIELSYFGNVYINSGDFIIKDNLGDIQFRVYNDGLIRAREVKVNLATIPPDYVFEKSYKLIPMKELELFIKTNKHLPNIPSAREMQEQGGIEISAMQLKLLEKIEELTLYLIYLNNENEELKRKICAIEGKL